jgi:predicted nucleic acid-binding protein
VAVILDSDAVVGFLDRDDALHASADAAIRDLAPEQSLVVSAVTYAEVLTGARLGHHDEESVEGFFAELITAIVPVGVEVATLAADLRARAPTLRMPDALILATAEVDSDSVLLLTGDAVVGKVPGLDTEVRLLRR